MFLSLLSFIKNLNMRICTVKLASLIHVMKERENFNLYGCLQEQVPTENSWMDYFIFVDRRSLEWK